MAGVWCVVHKPRVAVRSEPSTSGQIVGSLRTNDEVRPVEASGAWLRLEGDTSGWVLSDGATVGLGTLLQRVDDKPMRLQVKHPSCSTRLLLELELPGSAPVAEARAALARAGLEPSAALPCKRGNFADIVPDSATLYDAGFRDGDEFTFAYSGVLPEEGGSQAATLQRLRDGAGTPADIGEAVKGHWEAEAIDALLESVVSGCSQHLALLFGWGLSPQLDAVSCSEPQEHQGGTVLLLGWGGSTAEQLEAPRNWWHGRGCKTVVTTRGGFDVESQLSAVVEAVPSEGPLLVHAFSNNGLYMWCDLQHSLGHRAVGVVIDSAPDTGVDDTLIRQVANGCIRALCAVHRVTITEAADQALATMEASACSLGRTFPDLTRALLQPTATGEACSLDAGGAQRAPALFIYSRADKLIKPAAVEAYVASFGGEEARTLCVEGSQHVRHFARHRARYTEELALFAESLGFPLQPHGE